MQNGHKLNNGGIIGFVFLAISLIATLNAKQNIPCNASCTKQPWFPKIVYDFSRFPQVRIYSQWKDMLYDDLYIQYDEQTGIGQCLSHVKNGLVAQNVEAVPSLKGLAYKIKNLIRNGVNLKIRHRVCFSARHPDDNDLTSITKILNNLAESKAGQPTGQGLQMISQAMLTASQQKACLEPVENEYCCDQDLSALHTALLSSEDEDNDEGLSCCVNAVCRDPYCMGCSPYFGDLAGDDHRCLHYGCCPEVEAKQVVLAPNSPNNCVLIMTDSNK